MVSVIVPIYNVEKYLKKCVDSILSQSYKNIEIILVDDGSTDSCPDIVDSFVAVDNRVKAVHKKNGGLVSARQAGLEASSGEYILYVDGDDWIDVNCLEVLADIASKNNVDLVCCKAFFCFRNKNIESPLPYRIGLYNRQNIICEIFPTLIHGLREGCFPSNAWGKLYKRDKLIPHQMNVDPKIVMGEDIAFTKPLIASISSMYLVDRCLYYYNNMNVDSITHARKCLSWEGPQLIATILNDRMCCQEYDFKMQINRYFTHSLFNVAVSQFNARKSYFRVSKEICCKLQNKAIHQVIKGSVFSGWKCNFARFVLLHKVTSLMYLYWMKKFL